MKRFLIVCALAVAVAVAVPAQAASRSARVALVDRNPVTVLGTGFHARERVTLRVDPTIGVTFAKVVVANAAGRFVATFPARELDPCSGYRIVAVGRAGTSATGRELPPPCGIQIAP